MTTESVIESCARAAHEVNRVYCLALGDNSQPPWEEAPDWQKNSARQGVEKALDGASPEEMHQNWMDLKTAEGWVYGPVKDVDRKTHPCMLPYDQLPRAQQKKDALYQCVVSTMAMALLGPATE